MLKLEQTLLDNNDSYTKYQSVKSELENIKRVRTKGIMLRSRANWIEFGEKNSKYFFNLEKRNHDIKYIKKVVTVNGKEITSPKEILQEEVSFYSDLYSSKLDKFDKATMEKFLKTDSIPKLNNDDKSFCEEKLTISDLTKACKILDSMANNKSPGVDGFTTEFYKCFWDELKIPLHESYLYSFDHGKLADGQRRGLLNLIPKPNKDLRLLKSWRPVSLLAMDYKILTKALSIKLQKVIPSLINDDQVGYIKGRNISEITRIIDDIISLADLHKTSGFLTLIDFEKAFDTVEWPFLFQTLKSFNFGNNFITWIKLLYTEIFSCVSNNGYLSNYFSLKRGIRQGCPISALLFILVAEILAINIRADSEIKGIQVSDKTFKVSQLADDTTLYLKDMLSLERAISLFQDFGLCSGLKLNLDKTEVIPLGSVQPKDIDIPHGIKCINIRKQAFKTLGIWFSMDPLLSIELNYKERMKETEKLLYIWMSRNLTLKGKITVLKTLIVPKFIHLLKSILTPTSILSKIDKMFFDFLWNNKPSKIKRNTITNDFTEGGMRMPDIFKIHSVQKILWIKHLSDTRMKKWKTLSLELIGIEEVFLDFKLPEKNFKIAKTKFYQQVLDCWYSFKNHQPKSRNEILNEYVLYNKFIIMGNRCLDCKILKNKEAHMKMKLVDLLDTNFQILNYEVLTKKLSLRLSLLEYYGLRKAIPKQWLTTLHSKNLPHKTQIINEISVHINGTIKPINKIKNQEIYWELMSITAELPTSIPIWCDLFPFLSTYSWENIFERTFSVSKESYLQSFQYKIINRIINCRYNLFKWKIIESPTCIYCPGKMIDTVEHHFVYCESSALFWQDLKSWLRHNLNITFRFTSCEILFGIPAFNNPNLLMVNHLLLQGKNYLNNKKSKNEQLSFAAFLADLKYKTAALYDLYSNTKMKYKNFEPFKMINQAL